MYIPFSENNIKKLIVGQKTSTVRSERGYMSIGLKSGESCVHKINNVLFSVECLGFLSIEEAGGVEKMVESEGLASIDECMFQQTKNWFNGKGKLYVYKLKKL